jgi:arylsulfatase A-like enzyme
MAAGPADPGTATDNSRSAYTTPEWRYQLEILALSGFAVAQPVLDVFGDNLEAFVFRGADRLQIVVFALLVAFVPPLVLGALAAATRLLGPVVRHWAQVVLLSALAGLVGVHVVKQLTGIRGPAVAAVALLVAVGFGLAYQRIRVVAVWARYACLAPVLFVVVFLTISPTSTLVFPAGARAAEVDGARLPRNIVFLLFDELPTQSLLGEDGLIDAARFPNFRRFADESTWYRNYTTVNGSTEFAVPALMTGRYPKDEFATAASYPQNLFTLLGNSYDVRADEVITALCPQAVCTERSGGASSLRKLSGDAIDIWREQVSLHDSDRPAVAGFVEETEQVDDPQRDAFQIIAENAATSPTRLSSWLNQLDRGDRPTFDFLHLLLPHQPWHFYPSGREYAYPDQEPGQPHIFLSGRWGPESRPAELGRQRHLAQVRYVDTLLGRVVETLKARGLYDDSLIVVSADHGAAFRPGEEVRPGLESSEFPARTYEQVMWTPLMIRTPDQDRGRVSDANVQSIDLLPTIASELGVRIPWKVDGVSASRARRSPEKTFFTTSLVAFKSTALGDRREVDAQEGLRRMLAGNSRAFAPDPDEDWAVARAGPFGDLTGRTLREVTVGQPSPLEVRVDDPGTFASVDLRRPLPGLMLGNVVSESDAAVAVSVNGRVAGVSGTFDDNAGPRRFGVLIPDFLFVEGRNDVRLFTVEGSGAGAVLHPLRVAGLP